MGFSGLTPELQGQKPLSLLLKSGGTCANHLDSPLAASLICTRLVPQECPHQGVLPARAPQPPTTWKETSTRLFRRHTTSEQQRCVTIVLG
jgi:hypothetical protein